MAADTPIRFGLSMTDSDGLQASTTSHVYADAGQTITQVKTALAAWASAINVVTGAHVTSTRASILGPGADATGKPVSGSEISEVGTFDFLLATSGYRYGLVVPAFLESKELGGEKIDNTDTDVAALIALMLAGVLGGHYTGANVDTLSSFNRSFSSNRKHRRQLFRSSVNYTPPT